MKMLLIAVVVLLAGCATPRRDINMLWDKENYGVQLDKANHE
jgi:hypothetical protein